MTLEMRDLIAIGAIVISLVSVLLVSRNARRANSIHAQNTDLTRIRDLRSELAETKTELNAVKGQVHAVSLQLTEASEAATRAYRERQEMIRYARMPGVTLEEWLRRFDTPPELNGRIDRG